MESGEILTLIELEIAGDWSHTNAHGVNLRTCLVTPEKKLYHLHPNGTQELWLVLEEDPTTRGGYKIVYDDVRKEFGLATADISDPIDFYLGPYGSFFKTLDAM